MFQLSLIFCMDLTLSGRGTESVISNPRELIEKLAGGRHPPTFSAAMDVEKRGEVLAPVLPDFRKGIIVQKASHYRSLG